MSCSGSIGAVLHQVADPVVRADHDVGAVAGGVRGHEVRLQVGRDHLHVDGDVVLLAERLGDAADRAASLRSSVQITRSASPRAGAPLSDALGSAAEDDGAAVSPPPPPQADSRKATPATAASFGDRWRMALLGRDAVGRRSGGGRRRLWNCRRDPPRRGWLEPTGRTLARSCGRMEAFPGIDFSNFTR